ncbi:MAG: hypothetical protein LC754_13870 [Acidobacteria bacterium]|nr:hypothetical protein [Acidobacteriota bacterium]
MILNWPAPARNAPDKNVQSIRRVDVFRLAEGVNDPLPLTEEEFSARATLIGSLPFETIQRAGDSLNYVDELALTEPVRLRYAVRYVNAAGQRASFSNFLLIEPAASISQQPVLNANPEVSDNAITIRWQAPIENVDGSKPANLLGYNIYRATRAQNEPAQTPLNSAPLTTTQYADQIFNFGEEYVYVVRAVSLGTGGAPVESLNSNAVTVSPIDSFAPSAPTGVTAAASAGAPARISIFFAANPERDVIGYNIYRSTDPNLPKEKWLKLNRALIEHTAYQDDSVRPGLKYFYYLTAVDRVGNTSLPSDVQSDTVP